MYTAPSYSPRLCHWHVVVEGFYGWQVNSLALLADARHNLSDVGWLILAWLHWQLPGYYRMIGIPSAGGAVRSLPAFINAVILLVVMGSFGWESLQRLQTPVPILSTWLN
ncbi:cation transporter [Pseudomonas mohnii]